MKALRNSALALVVVAATASVAGAETTAAPKDAAKPAANATELFDKLPGGGKIDIPKTVALPKSVPGTEKVDGFYVEIPPGYGTQHGPSYAMVYASAEEATARNQGQDMGSAPPTCFMTAYPSYGQEVNWSASFATTASVQNYNSANYPNAPQYGSVNLVRSDRIVKEEKNKLSYEVKLAYVDAETKGVKLVSKQSLEFSLVNELPGNVKVWGAKTDDSVTFLVRRVKHDKERFFFGPLMVTVNGQHLISGAEACPVVFSLKTGKGVSANAVVQLEALLDIVDVDQEGGEGFISALPKMHNPGGFVQREAKVRPMRIGVSNTWMSQDTKPVVSVSHGWAGRERTQPI